MSKLNKLAIQLAKRPYSEIVFLDQNTDDTFGYVALTPELEGCMSDGDTVEEAKANLLDARIDYIESMLEDGLEIPEPQLLKLTESDVIFMSEFTEVHDGKSEVIDNSILPIRNYDNLKVPAI